MTYRMSNAGVWNPWRRLRDLEEQFSRMLGESPVRRSAAFPAVNIYTNADGAVVTAELPGVEPDALDVSAMGATLTVKGERKIEDGGESRRAWHRRERAGGRFVRTIELPFTIDPESVEARFVNGVLRVQVARPEKDKPRKIQVKVS